MKIIFIILLTIISIVAKAQSVTLTPNGAWVPSMTTTARTALTATDGQLVYDTDTKSFWYYNATIWKEISTATSDNLGNHTATQNINIGTNFISIDGTSKGLSLNSDGSANISTNSSNSPSFIVSSGNTPAYRIFQEASGIYPTYSWDLGGNETAFFLKDVSNSNKLPIRVYAGQNTDRLVVRNNNVGIGVNNPTEALEISGKTKTTNFQMSSGATNGHILQSDADGNASWVAPTVLPNANWTINGSNQYSALAGNVGIGTSSPTEKLMVEGNINIKNGRLAFQDDYSSILIGGTAGLSNAADYNVFIGNNAGRDNTTGEYNTFVGNFAGKANISAFHNTALGFGALENNTSGSLNTALGFYSLNKNTTGKENVATGYDALENNTTASYNTANGYYALKTNTIGNGNAAFGYRSLQNNISANYNASFGYQALKHNTDGEENTAMGTLALESNTTGDYNVAVGMNALTQNTEGTENTAIGYEAGYGNTVGDGNVFLGRKAGYFETGSDKLYIANSETPLIYGDFTTNNIGIGTTSLPSESNLVIAGNSNGEGGQLQLNASPDQSIAYFLDNYMNAFRIMSGTNAGSSSVRFYINSSGNIGIGTVTPSGKLDVAGSGAINSNVRSTDNIASIAIESPNQNDATLSFNRYDGTSSLKRWAWLKANSNETGSNAGGDIVLNRYSDAGAYLGQPILVYRNSGAVVIGNEGTSTTENTFRVNGSIAVKRTVYNTNSTIAGNDHLIGVTSTSAVTLTLPSATGIAGREYIIKSEASSASITITTTATQKIDGASSKSITSGYGVLRVYSDGSNWFTF